MQELQNYINQSSVTLVELEYLLNTSSKEETKIILVKIKEIKH